MVDLTLGIITVAAAADSINPCVFGVLIFLMAYMGKVFKSKHRMLLAGMLYILSVYLTYFLIGLGILSATSKFSVIAPYFYWFAAIIAILAGLFEIKDYFWYGKGFSLQMIPGANKKLRSYVAEMEHLEVKHPFLSLAIAFALGIFVVLVELPCTGAPYLAIIGLLSAGNLADGIPLLLYYNLVFIAPLFVLVALMYGGRSSKSLEKWRKEHRGVMRLGVGLFLVALGAYMIYAVTG